MTNHTPFPGTQSSAVSSLSSSESFTVQSGWPMIMSQFQCLRNNHIFSHLSPTTNAYYVLSICQLVYKQHERRFGSDLSPCSLHVDSCRTPEREKQLISWIGCCVQVAGSDSGLSIEMVQDRAVLNFLQPVRGGFEVHAVWSNCPFHASRYHL